MRIILAATALAALAATPATAVTFNLINIGGVTAGSASAKAFQAAANFWSARLTNNVAINLQVGYSALGTNILGSTSSNSTTASVGTVVSKLSSVGTSQLDGYTRASLAQWSGGAVNVITPGYINTATKTGINTATRVFDTDGSVNNRTIGLTTANAKALGLGISASTIDATIKFSNSFAFDFDPSNGISAGTIDFVGVAIHEIGHALGFVSGVDDYDYVGSPKGPARTTYANYAANNDWWGYTLDLFRYTANYNSVGGAGAKLDWAPNDASYFSIAGGPVYKGGNFSTGYYNGDKWQASHWKRTTSAAALGVMDPAVAYGQQDVVTALDLAAFDAIGWNVDFNVMTNSSWKYSTKQVGLASGLFGSGSDASFGRPTGVLAVPEPSSWALLIAGFGLVGSAARRRRAAPYRQ